MIFQKNIYIYIFQTSDRKIFFLNNFSYTNPVFSFSFYFLLLYSFQYSSKWLKALLLSIILQRSGIYFFCALARFNLLPVWLDFNGFRIYRYMSSIRWGFTPGLAYCTKCLYCCNSVVSCELKGVNEVISVKLYFWKRKLTFFCTLNECSLKNLLHFVKNGVMWYLKQGFSKWVLRHPGVPWQQSRGAAR